jgi:DNA-binding MarR family transcriptional regulator
MGSVDSNVGFDVVRLLLQCHRLEKGLAAAAGLSVDEFHCLSQLYVHAPCCVKTLCELTGIHPTRASRLLNALERKGYLTRARGVEDKRKESLTLTEEGIGAARSLLQSCALSRRSLAGSIREDEARHTADGLSEDYPGVAM